MSVHWLSRLVGAATSRANYHFVHPVLGTVPRFVWGNDAGVRGNVRGELNRARGRKAYRAATGIDVALSREARELRAQGYLRIEPPVPAEIIDPIRASYAACITDPALSDFNGVGKYRETSRAVKDPARRIAGLDALLTPALRKTVEGYFGSWFDVLVVEAWRTTSLPGKTDGANVEAYSNQWHNDRFPTSWLRLFVYLSDGVTRETGAFRCHTRTSTKRIMRSGGYLRRSLVTPGVRAALEDPSRVVYLEGDAGTACFANAMHCLHRAGIPRPGYARDMLALTFRPAAKELPAEWTRTVPAEPPYAS